MDMSKEDIVFPMDWCIHFLAHLRAREVIHLASKYSYIYNLLEDNNFRRLHSSRVHKRENSLLIVISENPILMYLDVEERRPMYYSLPASVLPFDQIVAGSNGIILLGKQGPEFLNELKFLLFNVVTRQQRKIQLVKSNFPRFEGAIVCFDPIVSTSYQIVFLRSERRIGYADFKHEVVVYTSENSSFELKGVFTFGAVSRVGVYWRGRDKMVWMAETLDCYIIYDLQTSKYSRTTFPTATDMSFKPYFQELDGGLFHIVVENGFMVQPRIQVWELVVAPEQILDWELRAENTLPPEVASHTNMFVLSCVHIMSGDGLNVLLHCAGLLTLCSLKDGQCTEVTG